MPNNVKTYDGSDDPKDHLKIFQAPAKAFLANFLQQKKYIKDSVEIHHIKQREGESTKDFVHRFKAESMHVKGAPECMRISGFMHGITNPRLIKRLHDNIPKSVDEMMRRVARQRITQIFFPDPDIWFLPLGEVDGTEGPMIIEAEIGGHIIHRIYVDGGSASEILGCGTFNLHMDEFRGGEITISVQWDHRKVGEEGMFLGYKVNTKGIKVITEMTGGGADYCFECVGLSSVVHEAYASCRKGWGKTVALEVDKLDATLTFNSFEELQLDKFVTHEVDFKDINKVFDLLHEAKSLR
nr:alcohol dehydrogenase-like 7 [Tanacetum cinerariifolium]